jgi:DNA repair photolyase
MTKIIYEPRGKAKEYCELAVNLYRGCSHGCIYCYAPSVVFMDSKDFQNNVKPRNNIIKNLKEDAENNPGKGRYVLLSFTSDAYQELDQELQLTRQAIKILKDNNYNIVILTKAGLKATRDFDLLNSDDWVGSSLTTNNDKDSLIWELKAALPDKRIELLQLAKEKGLNTWASLEPVIYPEQSLDIIDKTHEFIDLYKVGKLNYHKKANEINWYDFGNRAIEKLEKYGNKYYIKKDLKKYLTKSA